MCYRDKTFCSANCATTCSIKITEVLEKEAIGFAEEYGY